MKEEFVTNLECSVFTETAESIISKINDAKDKKIPINYGNLLAYSVVNKNKGVMEAIVENAPDSPESFSDLERAFHTYLFNSNVESCKAFLKKYPVKYTGTLNFYSKDKDDALEKLDLVISISNGIPIKVDNISFSCICFERSSNGRKVLLTYIDKIKSGVIKVDDISKINRVGFSNEVVSLIKDLV